MNEIDKTKGEIELFEVEGYRITPIQFRALELYFIENKKPKEIAETLDIKVSTVRGFINSNWWAEIHDKLIEGEMRDFQHQLMSKKDIAVQAFDDIMSGLDPTDRTAGARMKGVEMLMLQSKNPLIIKNNQMHLFATKTTNNVNIVLTPDQLQKLTSEQLLTFANTGEMPEIIEVKAEDLGEVKNDEQRDKT